MHAKTPIANADATNDAAAWADLARRCVLCAALLIAGNMVLPWIPALLVILGLLALFTTGVALILSAANVFYHDVNYLWGILAQILFYATPVIYNPATIEVSALRFISNYGPTGSFVTAVHNVLYDLRIPSLGRLVQLAVLGFGTFFLGASLFNRLSPRFAEEM